MSRYERGDYVKVEFEGAGLLPAEWMWVQVDHSEEERRLIFGKLENEPIAQIDSLRLGEELAVSYDKIREPKKPWEFKPA